MPPSTNPNRTYTIGLLVLAFFLLVGIGDMVFIRRSRTIDPAVGWVFLLIAYIECLFVVAIIVKLALRAWAPQAGNIATVALNIVLLFFFPFGTFIGIYGLKKVDKGPSGLRHSAE